MYIGYMLHNSQAIPSQKYCLFLFLYFKMILCTRIVVGGNQDIGYPRKGGEFKLK